MSGKVARKLRKKQFSILNKRSKRIIALCAGVVLFSAIPLSAQEKSEKSKGQFLLSLYPKFTKPFGEAHQIQYGIGGGLNFTWRPVKVINVFAQGEYLSMAMPGIDPIAILNGSIGAGYHFDFSDRIGLDCNVDLGLYNAKASERSITGLSGGVSIVFSYRFNPVVSATVSASGTHFASASRPLMVVNAGIAPGVTFNISELFNNSTNLAMNSVELAPVFPSLYSWYENNSFGKVQITNNEEYAITDVSISFFQPQYMAHEKECVKIKKIDKGETIEADLLAFFDEQMLELTERTDTNSLVIVNYSCLGRKRTQSFMLDVPVYGRNNMSWDDDRRAAVFVSSKDPAAMQFAKYVASLVRENQRTEVPMNIQYALGIFEALNQFGINYVVDPSSAFEDNVGTSSIDFLQFPYQTLMYKGGDCDDLSILFCSLFEAVGIRTAFITVPGHIFMAFDSGLNEQEADEKLKYLYNYIVIDDEVWVPLEITMTDEGFYKAYRYGSREWTRAYSQGTAAIYKMEDSWKIYPPISVPGAAAKFSMPEETDITDAFAMSIEEYSFGEIRNLLQFRPVKIAEKQEEQKIVEFELNEENPFSDLALREVLALAGVGDAIVPIGIREEELEDDEDEELEDLFSFDSDDSTHSVTHKTVAVKSNETVNNHEALANSAVATNSAVAANSAPVVADTAPIAANSAPIAADTAPVTADTARVTANSAPIAADAAPIAADTAPVADDTAPIAADTAPVTADTAPITTNSAPVTADTAPIAANSAPVTADTAPIAANSARVTANTAQVTANSSPVTADTAPVAADTAPVAADTAPITANTAPIAADTAPIAADTAPVTADTSRVVADAEPIAANTVPIAADITKAGGVSAGTVAAISAPFIIAATAAGIIIYKKKKEGE